MRQRIYLTKNPNKIDEILILVLNQKFDEDVKRLRRDFTGLQPFLLKRGCLTAARVLRRPQKDLDRAILHILPKHKLPETWLDFVRNYVLRNELMPEEGDPDGVVIEIDDQKNGGQGAKEARLILHHNLNIDTVKKAWPQIRKMLFSGKQSVRKRLPDNFDRDYEIMKLREAGRTSGEISQIMKDKYGHDFLQGVYKNADYKIRKRLDMPIKTKRNG